jgi:hypothetical protein
MAVEPSDGSGVDRGANSLERGGIHKGGRYAARRDYGQGPECCGQPNSTIVIAAWPFVKSRRPISDTGVVEQCLGFSAAAVGSNNPAAEKRTRFHPRASSELDEKRLARPNKMKPPPAPAAGLIGQFWPFSWGATASPPDLAGRIGMNFLRPVGRMKIGNLRVGRQEKLNLAEIA